MFLFDQYISLKITQLSCGTEFRHFAQKRKIDLIARTAEAEGREQFV